MIFQNHILLLLDIFLVVEFFHLIEVKKEDSSRWFAIAAGIGGFSASSEAVQSTKNPQKMSDAGMKRIDIENEIKALEAEREEILKTLERLTAIEYMLLVRVYVNGFSNKQIAHFFKMSLDWAKKKKRAALDHLQKILDEQKD